jgi:hypothetical protein
LKIKDIKEKDEGYYKCKVIIYIKKRIYEEVDLKVSRNNVIYDK